MKTIINLYNNNEIIATSEVRFNPTSLVKCYLDFIDNPKDYILTVSTFNSLGHTTYVIGAALEGAWRLLVTDEWFYPSSIRFDTKAELTEHLEECLKTQIEIYENERVW